MTREHRELTRLRADCLVILGRQFERLDAVSVGALARDRKGSRDSRNRLIHALYLLVDGAKQRLVAGGANLALVLSAQL
jgi:hypothetical protein